MKTANQSLDFNSMSKQEQIEVLRKFIIYMVGLTKYFVAYKVIEDHFDISRFKLWHLLDEMGNEDVLNKRPRTDAWVGGDEPSNGHYAKKKLSPAYDAPWKRSKYLRETIVALCNFYNLVFKQKIVLSNGSVKYLIITQGINGYGNLGGAGAL